MKDYGKLALPLAHAEGHVTLEYTDGVTGKVKERIKGDNLVFPGGLLFANMRYVLSNVGILLSDYSGEIKPAIPQVPGNVIGYGYVGSTATGTFLGAENTAVRNVSQFIDNVWHDTRSWSWLPSQVPGVIKCISLGRYYQNEPSSYYMSSFSSPIQFPWGGDADSINSNTLLNQKLLRVYVFGNLSNWSFGINYYNLNKTTSESTWVLISNLISKPQDFSSFYYKYPMVCVDVNTNNIWFIYSYRDSTSNLYLSCNLLDLDLATLISTDIYQISSSSPNPICGYGGGNYANVGYYKNGYFYCMYPSENISPYKVKFIRWATASLNPSTDFLDSIEILSDSFSFLSNISRCATSLPCGMSISEVTAAFQGRASYLDSTRYSIINLVQIVNLSDNTLYCAYPQQSQASNSIPVAVAVNQVPLLINFRQSGSVWYIDGTNTAWINQSHYTCYKLPPSAPVRQVGQGVTVTYELAYGF